MIPFVDLELLHSRYRDQFRRAFDATIDASAFVGGESVESFEASLAAYTGAEFAIGVNSGTAALQIGLLAAGVGRGDEVILPATTFFATLEAVVHTGATPVVVDVDDSACIDVEAVKAAISPKTTAVVAVHLYGQPADMPSLRELCTRHGLLLMEDAAQAIGGGISAAEGVQRVGSMGDLAAFSFYPTKNLGALGDGGAIATNDPSLAEKARLLRAHGDRSKNDHHLFGFTERLHSLQARILDIKLHDLDAVQSDRDRLALTYTDGLAALEVTRPRVRENSKHVWHLQTVWLDDRDVVATRLRDQGVATALHYPQAMNTTPAFLATGAKVECPRAEEIAKRTLSLPFYPYMGTDRINRVLEALEKALVV